MLEAVQGAARRRRAHAVAPGGGVGTHDRLRRKAEDDLARHRVAARRTRPIDQVREQRIDVGPKSRRGFERRRRRIGERPDPVVDTTLAEVDETGDVAAGVDGQDHADRWHQERRHATAAEHDMDQTSARSAVAVAERVDGLELRVRYRRLGHSRQVGEVDESDEVVQQPGDAILGRRHERGVRGTDPSAPDPVLLLADDAGVPLLARLVEQRPMDVEQIVEAEGSRRHADRDGPLHGVDVAEDGSSDAVGRPRFVRWRGRAVCSTLADPR